MFANSEIDTDNLPRAENVSWHALDRNYVKRLHTQAAIALVMITIAIVIVKIVLSTAMTDANPDLNLAWLWLIPLMIGSLLIAWPLLSVPKMGYALREHDILYKSGVFWHTVSAIPFNRIQHVEKSSTPLDRRFELSTLQLFTAGGSGGDLKIHGLPAASAEKLRTYILRKVGSAIEQR